jgi:hypothetical protein
MITDGLVDTDRQTGKNRQVLDKAKKTGCRLAAYALLFSR